MTRRGKATSRDLSSAFSQNPEASAHAIDCIIGATDAIRKLKTDKRRLMEENALLRQKINELENKLEIRKEIMDLRSRLRPV